MRHSGDPRSPKPNQLPGRFIPNKKTEPQLGRIQVRKSDGSIVSIPMNRKDRRAAIREELRRQKRER